MEFTIYSIGDSEFLEQVMIALALLGGYGEFTAIVKVGFLLGVFGVFVSAMLKGGKTIEFQHILIGFIIWGTMFAPTARVIIEDSYTGYTTAIDDVPMGPAAAGGIISLVGYRITKMFEVAYDPIIPKVTETEFAESLSILNKIRRNATGNGIWIGMNSDAGGGFIDLKTSWINYIRDCTLKKIDLGLMSPNQLITGKLEQSLSFNSGLFGTRIFTSVADAGGQLENCTAAWAELNNTTNFNGTLTIRAFNSVLGLNSSNLSAGESALTKTTNSLGSLINGAIAATTYMKLAVLEPILMDAAAGKYNSIQDNAAAIMINQAIQQRNTQWAAEQTLFMSIVRPMLAFFEAFTYAVTPVMAFVVALGAKGVQLAGKYFILVIWIQLWMPILSIVNLYIHTVTSRSLQEYNQMTTHNWDSFYALNSGIDTIQHWIATGGLLASSTPAIALTLIYGSSVTATHLAGRVNSSSSNINQKYKTPDLTNNPAALSQTSLSTQTAATGTIGGGEVFQSVNFASNFSEQASSFSRQARNASNTLNDTLIAGMSSGTNDTINKSRATQYAKALAAGDKEAYNIIQGTVARLDDNYNINDSNRDQVMSMVGGMFSGNISAGVGASLTRTMGATFKEKMAEMGIDPREEDMPKPKVSDDSITFAAEAKLDLSGGGSKQSTSADSKSSSVGKTLAQGLTQLQNHTNDASLDRSIASGFRETKGHKDLQTWGDTKAIAQSQAFAEASERADSYEKMAQQSMQFGIQGGISLDNMAVRTMRDPEMTQQLLQTADRIGRALGPGSGFNANLARSAKMYHTQRGVESETQARVMAAYQTLSNYLSYKSNGIKTKEQVQDIAQEGMLAAQNIYARSQGNPTLNIDAKDYMHVDKNKNIDKTPLSLNDKDRQKVDPRLANVKGNIANAKRAIEKEKEKTNINADKTENNPEVIDFYNTAKQKAEDRVENMFYKRGLEEAAQYNESERNGEGTDASVPSVLDGTWDRMKIAGDAMIQNQLAKGQFFSGFSGTLASMTQDIHGMDPANARAYTEQYKQDAGMLEYGIDSIRGIAASTFGNKPEGLGYGAYYERLSEIGISSMMLGSAIGGAVKVAATMESIREEAYRARLEEAQSIGLSTQDGTAQMYAESFAAGLMHELKRFGEAVGLDLDANEDTPGLLANMNTFKQSLLNDVTTDAQGYQLTDDGNYARNEDGNKIRHWERNANGSITLTNDTLEEFANNVGANIHKTSWSGEWGAGQLADEVMVMEALNRDR
ncbi:MAG: conjugal transfer protein TraG N-terminal domain-containing protein [Cellvibrionaceae bacterium]|nr:conjugal transfer protein TraG N-terminal domain-containing protein [Cellvibrionaceae bacterium]